jgi:hemerythrin-like domain-containing protein
MSSTLTATQLLRNDHRTVRGLFQQARAFRDRDREMRVAAVKELFLLLDIHSSIEEQFFYPELQDSEEAAAIVEQSLADHQEMDDLVKDLEDMDPMAEGFDNGLAELLAAVELHVDTEENQLFPIAERLLADRLTAIADDMSRYKQEALRSWNEALSRGGEQKRKGESAA